MKRLYFIPLVVAASVAHSADLDYSIGATIDYSVISYEDDDGTTDTESVVFPIRLYGELELDTVNSLVIGWRPIDFDVDATKSGDMGATFKGNQIDAVWLHQVRLGREFKPWVGVGLRTSMVDVKGKHLVDADGYLIERFDATSETQLAGLLEGYYEWQVTRSGWYLNAAVTYDVPLGDGFESFGASAGIKMEF